MSELRNALERGLHASACRYSVGHEAGTPGYLCFYCAADLLADPDFRAAFERALAKALAETDDYTDMPWATPEMHAAAIAAQVFGETP